MSYQFKMIKERFDLLITTEKQVQRSEFIMDQNSQFLVGIALTSDREEMIYYRGEQKISINGTEIFPSGFESKLLISGLNVSPNDRMITLDSIPTGNKRIEVIYTDRNHDLMPFSPYRVSLYAFSVTTDQKR